MIRIANTPNNGGYIFIFIDINFKPSFEVYKQYIIFRYNNTHRLVIIVFSELRNV